jgi:hypothetical protein
MKKVYLFFALFAVMLGSSGALLLTEKSPEEMLVGQWQEISWEYEKVNHNGDLKEFTIDDGQKEEICKNLIMHRAEVWQFDQKKQLTLIAGGVPKERVIWNIKGRGHILNLQHKSGKTEEFQIQEISADSLVIHFSFDLQVKGIVKTTFKKVKEDKTRA